VRIVGKDRDERCTHCWLVLLYRLFYGVEDREDDLCHATGTIGIQRYSSGARAGQLPFRIVSAADPGSATAQIVRDSLAMARRGCYARRPHYRLRDLVMGYGIGR
jgi:hypothetical protein